MKGARGAVEGDRDRLGAVVVDERQRRLHVGDDGIGVRAECGKRGGVDLRLRPGEGEEGFAGRPVEREAERLAAGVVDDRDAEARPDAEQRRHLGGGAEDRHQPLRKVGADRLGVRKCAGEVHHEDEGRPVGPRGGDFEGVSSMTSGAGKVDDIGDVFGELAGGRGGDRGTVRGGGVEARGRGAVGRAELTGKGPAGVGGDALLAGADEEGAPRVLERGRRQLVGRQGVAKDEEEDTGVAVGDQLRDLGGGVDRLRQVRLRRRDEVGQRGAGRIRRLGRSGVGGAEGCQQEHETRGQHLQYAT